MLAWLRQRFAASEPAPAPLPPLERARLEHERRLLEREARRYRRAAHAADCRTCVPASPHGVRLSRRKREIESRLDDIERRLSA